MKRPGRGRRDLGAEIDPPLAVQRQDHLAVARRAERVRLAERRAQLRHVWRESGRESLECLRLGQRGEGYRQPLAAGYRTALKGLFPGRPLRAALLWTEAVTDIARTGVPDDVFAAVRAHFDEEELVALTMAVVAINGWNRLAVGFRAPVGGYVPGQHAA